MGLSLTLVVPYRADAGMLPVPWCPALTSPPTHTSVTVVYLWLHQRDEAQT